MRVRGCVFAGKQDGLCEAEYMRMHMHMHMHMYAMQASRKPGGGGGRGDPRGLTVNVSQGTAE